MVINGTLIPGTSSSGKTTFNIWDNKYLRIRPPSKTTPDNQPSNPPNSGRRSDLSDLLKKHSNK